MSDGHGDSRPSRNSTPCSFAIGVEEPNLEGVGDSQSGNLTWRSLISADRTPATELIVGMADFPPHGRLNRHRHAPAEFYFCLAGAGTFSADGVALRIATGTAVFIPPNAEHELLARAEGLSIVYGFARNAFEDIEYVYTPSGSSNDAFGTPKRYPAHA